MTELLAPAGSVEALHSAVNAGCDAVYIGGKMFGARAYANNPDVDELLGAIDHCHVFNKKIYLTVNTLLKNDELTENLYNFLRPYYQEGLDGVIVSDIGVMAAVSKWFPKLPIHISTQASITSAEGADVISRTVKGITRVVPARELSIEEIESFKKKTDLELEVFVHGAMCVCYSGQCLMSSLVGGRSGNRGRCAQPCRKNYDSGINDSFILSCKDMCTIPAIGRLIRAGVDSFKIEGRMKSPVYVAATVEAYRKYMDIAYEKGDEYEYYLESHASELEKDIDKLREIYNRGGFCTGFMLGEKNLICSDKASHNGVFVGTVEGVSGREARIVFENEVNPKDVLEIRKNDGSSLYEFTSGNHYRKGSEYKILVSKGQKATIGQRVFRVKNTTVIDDITDRYVDKCLKRKIGLRFKAKKGMPLKLSVYLINNGAFFDLSDSNNIVTVCGACPDIAKTAWADTENIRKHLTKTGESLFEVVESDIDIDEGLFIPVGAVNTIRREALEELEIKLINRSKRDLSDSTEPDPDIIDIRETDISIQDRVVNEKDVNISVKDRVLNNLDKTIEKHALVYFEESLKPVLDDQSIKRIYLPVGSLKDPDSVIKRFKLLSKQLEYSGRELYVALPYICREATLKELKESGIIENLSGCCGFLVRNNEELSLLIDNTKRMILDHTMHLFNKTAVRCYGREFTYSPELNREELLSFGMKGAGELLIYGRLPLMQTAHCVYVNEGQKCLKACHNGTLDESFLTLKDSKGYKFPVIRRCDTCTNIILNGSILDLRDLNSEIEEIRPGSVRFDFTTESPQEIDNVLKGFREDENEYTFGHFKRGVM
ncbi:MAG: U32 family peptidase [Lachnospiraceae bacterium]|nr:U32 family peptidase [Lachnospiraceae bacterium]